MRTRPAILAAALAVSLALAGPAYADITATLTRTAEPSGLNLHFHTTDGTLRLRFAPPTDFVIHVTSGPANGCGVSKSGHRILCQWTGEKQFDGDIGFTTEPCYPAGGAGTMAVDGPNGEAYVGTANATGPPDPCPGTPSPGTTPLPTAASNELRALQGRTMQELAATCLFREIVSATRGGPLAKIASKSFYAALAKRASDVCNQKQQRLHDIEVELNQDPPDNHYGEVAVFKAAVRRRSHNCRSLAKRGKGTCRKLEAGMSSVFDAVAAGTAINHGLSTAMNRFSTAVADANAAGQALQQAALKAYSGLFADNLAAEHTAGTALATLYRKYGLRAKASTAKVRKAVSNLKAGRLAKGARGALRALGLTDPEIGAAARFAASLVPARPLDLVSLFRGTSQTTQMRAFQRTITLPEVRALFNALSAAGSIPAAAASTLGGDLSAAEHASTPAAARTAMTKFVANATGPNGPAVDLLRAAGAPLGA